MAIRLNAMATMAVVISISVLVINFERIYPLAV
jgi:hypothetical protein